MQTENIDLENRKSSLHINPKKGTMDAIIASPLMKSVLAGSVSGTCSTFLFQPLDLVKTRLQLSAANIGTTRVGVVAIFSNVVRNEKITGLWKGMTPSMFRCVPGVGIYFGSVHWLRSNYGHADPHPLESLVIGASARSFSAAVLIPFTVVKTRFESRQFNYVSITDALTKIYTAEGTRGLCSGLSATLLRDAPFSGLYLMFYTQAKKMVPNDFAPPEVQPLVHFACGLVSGVLASAATQPADVLKTKMQIFPNEFHNMREVIIYVYMKYGVTGYFKGLVPRALRRTLMAAMAWTVYEQLTRRLGLT